MATESSWWGGLPSLPSARWRRNRVRSMTPRPAPLTWRASPIFLILAAPPAANIAQLDAIAPHLKPGP